MANDIKAIAQMGVEFEQWNKNVAQAETSSNPETQLEPIEFDFQKDGAYSTGLVNLAQSQMFEMDQDSNGAISLEEYINSGLELYKDILDEETLNGLVESGAIESEFIAIDYNLDGSIGLDELMLLYSLADGSLDSETTQRVKDGKFTQEDLQQTIEMLIDTLINENPEREDQLQERLIDCYRNFDINSVLTKYDYNKDSEIAKNEFLTLKTYELDEEDKPEAKADAYVMYDLVDSVMGNGDGTVSEDEIGTFVDYANDKGMNLEEYYNWLLEGNFKDEDAGNHEYYEDVLAQFRAFANK